MNKDFEKTTSRITSQLNSRRDINRKFGSLDLNKWILDKIKINGNENLLDIGCGTGKHLIEFARLNKNNEFIGIDASETSISQAIKTAESENVRINFFVKSMDDADVSLKDKSFDNIMSAYAMYYSSDANKLLGALKRKIKDTGRIMVMTPYVGNNDDWYGFLRKFMEIPKKVQDTNYFMDNVVIPFAESNFTDVKKLEFVNKIIIPSLSDLDEYWKANIYHKEEYDDKFRSAAEDFFKNNKEFVFYKKGLLVVMQNKKN